MRLDTFLEVVPVLKTNVARNQEFSYLRIIGTQKEKEEKNVLFFPVTLTEEMVQQGWIQRAYDLRDYFEKIQKEHPTYTYVIEKQMEKQLLPNTKFIVVDNIMESIDLLFEKKKRESKAKVIAVTGSVGKTTAVSLLEAVLKERYSTTRIYSKRITPLLLKHAYLNQVTETTDFVLLEMSLHYRNHVQALSELLPPTIAGILNIKDTGLFIDSIETKEDLLKFKSKIYSKSKLGFFNQEDAYLKKLSYHDDTLYYQNKALDNITNFELFPFLPQKIKNQKETFSLKGYSFRPFVSSSLSKEQYMLAYQIASYLGIEDTTIFKVFASYQPTDHRLERQNIFGKDVVFDGDVSTICRLNALADHYYQNASLVIRKFGSMEKVIPLEQEKLQLASFQNVFVFEDVSYRELFETLPNVILVKDHQFMKNLVGTCFYHYSGYYRSFHTFHENNLLEIEQATYPVLPPQQKKKEKKMNTPHLQKVC